MIVVRQRPADRRQVDDLVAKDPKQIRFERAYFSESVQALQEVHITNNSAENEFVLTDWVLREDDESNVFTFVEDIVCRASMSGFTLQAGATVIITSGDSPLHSPPTHIAGWCEFVWDNDGDIARLFNPTGDLIVEAIGSFDSCNGG